MLGAFDYLAARRDVDSRHIGIVGKGNAGPLALYAATLEPGIARVACVGAPGSYMEILRARIRENFSEIIVPGVVRDFDLPDVAEALKPRAVEMLPEGAVLPAGWALR